MEGYRRSVGRPQTLSQKNLQLPQSISEIREFPNVPYADRDQLPSCAGVYFVTEGGDNLIYVGRSIDIHFRWQDHHKLPGVDFEAGRTRIYWMSISEVDDIPGIEVRLIHRFNPPLNFQHSTRRRTSTPPDHHYQAQPATKENLEKIPKVSSWISGNSGPLPRAIKEYTYNQHSGCCSFCGDPYPFNDMLTAPSFDEEAAGVRDAFSRFLACRYCRPLVRPRTDFKSFNQQKADVIAVATARVQRAFSILARFGYASQELERFLDLADQVELTFDIETRTKSDNKA